MDVHISRLRFTELSELCALNMTEHIIFLLVVGA